VCRLLGIDAPTSADQVDAARQAVAERIDAMVERARSAAEDESSKS
jgi:hypothetical protein